MGGMSEASHPLRCRYTTPAERAQWAQRFYQSGLTQQAFAQQQGLKLSTLQLWLAQTRSSAAKGQRRSRSQAKPLFREVKWVGASAGWAAEVVGQKGTVLRLAHDVPGGLLQELLSLC
jgi:hypothetical protein